MLTTVWPTSENPSLAPFVVRQVSYLRRAGVETQVFHIDGRSNPVSYLRAQRTVRDLASHGRFDLIHAQWGQSALAALPKRLPLVVTFRGSDVQGIVGANGSYTVAGGILTRISRFVARIADETIIVSPHLAHGLPERKYHVIPSGLDLDLFRAIPRGHARRQLGLDPARRYVLFVASPKNPIKRYELASAAVQLVQSRHDVALVVLDRCSHELVPVYMSACDALILTSRHEGSPNVAKEALACDLPVVSVDVGDVRHWIGALDGCALCLDDTPGAIAAGLDRVLSGGQGFRGRHAVCQLDEAILTQGVLSVYEQALAGARRPLAASVAQ